MPELLISSSVLILVLALLRLLLRERISARLQYALWLLVLVRLLLPLSFFHSPVSVAEAAAPVTERAGNASELVLYEWNIPRSAPTEINGAAAQPDTGAVVNSGEVLLLRDALIIIWVLGMIFMAAWFLYVNLRLARQLRKTRVPYGCPSALPVYVAAGIPSPCLFGLLRPAVYLTEHAAADKAQARQIVAHELTHHRHGDMIWALLRSVCLVVWWFDPLVWLAAALSRQDCELACDEGTIKALGEEARFDYGRTLVGMAKVGARPSDLLCGATTMTTGKSSLRERVKRIADAPKTSVFIAVIVLIIAAIAVGCTFSGAANTEPEPENDALAVTPIPVRAGDEQDTEDLEPKWMELYYPHEAVTTSHDAEEVQAFFDVYRSIRALAAPPSDDFTDVSGDPIFSINLYPAAAGYMDYPVIYSLLLLEDEWFVLPDEADPVNGQALVWQDKNGLYSGLLEDLIDQFHSESVRPGMLTIDFFDAEAGTNLSDVVTEQIELGEFYDFFRFMEEKSTQDMESPGFSRPVSRTTLFFFADLAAYERDQRDTGFAVWEDGWFEFFHGGSGDTVYYDEDGSYLQLFEDLLDKWYAESAEAMFVGGEPIGGYDRAYWEEVDMELASFAYPADIEVSVADEFDEALPEDDIFGPLTLEDYIYGTDSWKFQYNGEAIANDPFAAIKVHDADGRVLWIMDDADALMIQEADGSITWVDYAGEPVDCADMIRHLLPWARGEYPTQDMSAAERERQLAEAQAVFDALGTYGVPGMEYDPGQAYVLESDPVRGTGRRPWWAGDLPALQGMTAGVWLYGADSGVLELDYGRYSLGGEAGNRTAFAQARGYGGRVGAITEGLAVGNYDAFFLEDGGGTYLFWYDTDAELVFDLTSFRADDGTPPLTQAGLIALAESVGPIA